MNSEKGMRKHPFFYLLKIASVFYSVFSSLYSSIFEYFAY